MTLVNLPNVAIQPIDEPRLAASLHPYQLGASLYMPATRQDLWDVVCQNKLPELDSMIICLEDAVSEADVEIALINVAQLLEKWAISPRQACRERPLVFLRPRHPSMLYQLASMPHIDLLDGFVLPKVDMTSLADWRLACQQHTASQVLMPTLETASIFNPIHNQELAMALTESFSQPIFALRIGGNDLFACLRLRRPSAVTIYDTPIGSLIYQLLGCFVPYGFYLTAPVFEHLNTEVLATEVARDIGLGLVGKTVIHPSQIGVVKNALAVDAITLAQAQAILASDAKAVFKQDNAMLEPATHRTWASQIMHRYEIFGGIVTR